jgi:hypothetical protein
MGVQLMSSSNYAPVTTTDTRRFGNDIRFRDSQNRLKVTANENIFEADFEYGTQPLRWEQVTASGGTVAHSPGSGGVQLTLTTTNGSLALRQSRPYHRYQPGKSLFMASAVLFGGAVTNNRTRIGFFDDSNGAFWEQADATATNPAGMFAVTRSDVNGTVVDTRVSFEDWSDPYGYKTKIDWTRIQMICIEYAWYGAGLVRHGVFVDGEFIPLHETGFGNRSAQLAPWSRTGNLPVRYELRNIGTAATGVTITHYGVSVLVDGGVDEQRGFTYAYGSPWNATSANAGRRQVAISANRIPVVSIRGRTMGTQEYTQASAAISGTQSTTQLQVAGTPWTVNQWAGRCVNYGTPASGMLSNIARIVSNTNNTLVIADVVTGGPATLPVNGQSYTIGLVNRGQILPRRLQITSDQPLFVEIVTSTPTSAVNLTGASFAANTSASNSFALVDSSATAFTVSGETVYSIFVPSNQPVDQQIDQLFPLVNSVRGNATDIMTVLVTNTAATAANVSVQIIGQEAMS